MSAIAEVRERIQLTVARIKQLEKAAAEPNPVASLFANIRGLEKVLQSLEEDFAQLARSEELEVCRYRLLPEPGQRPAMAGIAKAWMTYQELFSSVYEALVRGRRKRGIGKQVLAQTQLGFEYTFSGSIGVVLTLPSRSTDLITAKALERTTELIIEMAKTPSHEALADYAKRLGVPPVMKLEAWTNAQLAFEAGAGVQWEISQEPKPEFLVQIQEFRQLKLAMDKISEAQETVDQFVGLLRAADLDKRTFKMRLDSGESVSGSFEEGAITEQHRAILPQRYVATIKTTTKIKAALQKPEQRRLLLQLSQPDERLDPLP
jgi:hypothetical protein